MPFLTFFEPTGIDPRDHVDREADLAWLRGSLDSYLKAPDKSQGRCVAVLGERGIGKSILVRKVLDDLREIHTATTLFLQVDCRHCRTQRKVYQAIAMAAVDQLAGRSGVDPALVATARLLEAIASMDTVKQTALYERITAFKAAVKLGGKKSLLELLGKSYEINLERSVKSGESLDAAIHFDSLRLRDAVIAFFHDLRDHQADPNKRLDVIVVLDNLEELDHEAIAEERHRHDLLVEIDALLGLSLAPIGLVLTVRTYFAAGLMRAIHSSLLLEPMCAADHVALLDARLARESAAMRELFGRAEHRACIERLASSAQTPLALLRWFNFLAQYELHADPDIATNLRGLARAQYATVPMRVLEQVVAAFGTGEYPIHEDVLLAACTNQQPIFKQLLRYQIVLPVDFWNPVDFTLSPELHFLLPPRS